MRRRDSCLQVLLDRKVTRVPKLYARAHGQYFFYSQRAFNNKVFIYRKWSSWCRQLDFDQLYFAKACFDKLRSHALSKIVAQ